MDRTTAIKALTRILGKSLGYRVDPKAPSEEQRAEAKMALMPAIEARNKLREEKEARLQAILAADPEYQRLKIATKAASEEVDRLASITRHYKMTVGTTNGLFFTIKAEGDSWEQVIAKLK
jgi:GNAT superfamily N-acetyltransferase